MARFITAFDRKLKKRVLHRLVGKRAISVITGNGFRYRKKKRKKKK